MAPAEDALTKKKQNAPGEETPALSEHEQNQRINAPLLAKLLDALRKYKSTADTSQIDVLDNRFRIDLTQPLPEFDTLQTTAYAATDAQEPSKTLLARVCHWGTIQRYHAISKLKGVEHRGLVTLSAAGNIRLSTTQEERFVIFYERPVGIRLSELIKRRKIPSNTTFIIEHILSPLAHAIEQFGELDISHGLINPDNIFFNDTAVLGPCVAEPCGLSQPYFYESVERIQALPHAKGEGTISHDYYALAVVLLEILHGSTHLQDYTRESLTMALLKQGAYNALLREKDVPAVFYDFLRGTLTLNPYERWGTKQIILWLAGKRYNVLPPPVPVDGVRPFEFGEMTATTRRELAHVFCHNWEQMIAALNNNQLAHWVSISLRSKELSDVVGRLSRAAYDLSARNEMQTFEALSNIIMQLDTTGPIRIKNIAVHIDGFDSLCVEFYSRKANSDLQILARFIELNTINYWLELQKKVHKDDFSASSYVNIQNVRVDRLRGYIRNSGVGFGLERMLYELNPNMACISPLLASQNVTSLSELLIHLDRLAPQMVDADDLIDRHIAAFIASKLLILHEIHFDELAGIPMLAANKIIMSIYLLGVAQLRTGNLRLPGITYWLTLKTVPLMDFIHSRTIRNKYKSALMGLAALGSIPKLAELVVSADYANKDHLGFQEAFATFQHNAALIRFYEGADSVEVESVKMGFNIAKMVAYACLFGTIYLISFTGGL